MEKKLRAIRRLLPAFLLAAALSPLLPLVLFLIFLIVVPPILEARRQPVCTPYRGGSVDVNPDSVTAGGAPVPLKITYRVGPQGISTGGGLRLCRGKILRFGPERWRLCLQWGGGWGNLQRKHPHKPNFLRVDCSNREVGLSVSMMENAARRTQLRWLKRKYLQKRGKDLEPIDPRDAFIENQKVTVRVERGRLVEGDEIEFALGDSSGLELPYAAVETDFAIEVDPDGSGGFLLERAVPTLRATGGEPDRFEVVAPSTAAPGQKISLLVRCVDDRGVLSPWFRGEINFSAPAIIETPGPVKVNGQGRSTFRVDANVTGTGVARVAVRDGSGRIRGESNPVVCGQAVALYLWGDLHTHSLVSDGTMEPWYYYYRATELMGWDFTAISDHDIWSLAEEHPRTEEEFELLIRTANEAYRPGELVTFPAYEWTHHHLGHRNVLFGPGEEPVFHPKTDPRYATPERLLKALAGKDVIVIPHHPAWKTHRGEMFTDYGPPDNGLQRLVEVYSKHGSSEHYGCAPAISHAGLVKGMKGAVIRAALGNEAAGPRSGSYVRDALASGHRMGLIAGSDEHLTAEDPYRNVGTIYGGGLTCVLAEAVTRESVWEALKGRRAYGTTGARIYIEFLVNGLAVGSELTAASAPRVTGRVVGTADISRVEIVKFDGAGYSVPWKVRGEGSEAPIDFIDNGFESDSFYYLRVFQEDGHMGWAGPTWVDKGVLIS